MENKTAKITSVQENQRSYNGQNGTTYIHLIKFEGSDQAWEYHSLKQQCEKFKVGETQTFDTDVKVNGQYTNYKIKPAKDAPGGFKKGEPKDQGIITYLSCLSSVCNFFQQRQGDSNDVFKMADEAFNRAIQKSTLNKQ